MTLRHLRIFIEVADRGSMTATAESLFVAQPTISQAIAELERHYGTKLFDRLSKRLYITEPGRRLLDYARHITKLYDELEQTMVNPDMTGILKIGATLTVGASLMPGLICRFNETHPMVDVRVNVCNTRDIESMILKSELDFAIVEGEVQSMDIRSIPFMEDHLVLVCGRTHPLYSAGKLQLSDFAEWGFIVRETGSGTRERFESAATAEGVKWKMAWESNASDAIVNATVHGLGIGVVSTRLVTGQLESGLLQEIETTGLDLSRNFSIIHHKNKYLTDSMKQFFSLCHCL